MPTVVSPPMFQYGQGLVDAYRQLGQGAGDLTTALVDYYRRGGGGLYTPPGGYGPAQQIPPAQSRQYAQQAAMGQGTFQPNKLSFLGQVPISPDALSRLQMQQAQADIGLKQAQAQEARGKPAKEAAKQQRMNLMDSTKIREEFINRPEVKEYTTINTQVRSMDTLLKKAKEGDLQNKVALDQALVTMFNKLTDPQSVVRESEYARTAMGLPLANRFNGALQKLAAGGAGLTDSDRDALVWGAKVIANERGRTFNETRQQYVDLANEYDLGEQLVTRGVQPHAEYPVNVPTENGNELAPSLSPKAQLLIDRYYKGQ